MFCFRSHLIALCQVRHHGCDSFSKFIPLLSGDILLAPGFSKFTNIFSIAALLFQYCNNLSNYSIGKESPDSYSAGIIPKH